MAVGVAKPKAQGQAMMRTVIKMVNAFMPVGCGPTKYQMKAAKLAIAITIGTKTLEILSANFWAGA